MTYRDARVTCYGRRSSIVIKAATKCGHNYLEYNLPSSWCWWTIARLVCMSVIMKYDITKPICEGKKITLVKRILRN